MAGHIQEALKAYAEDLNERGETLPPPRHAAGTVARFRGSAGSWLARGDRFRRDSIATAAAPGSLRIAVASGGSPSSCPCSSTSVASPLVSEVSGLPLTGGCNCSAVRYEISEPPLVAGYCHCSRCQRRTGTAASPSAAVKAETFRIIRGEDHIRRWNAGDGNDKAFCGTCGSALFSENPNDPAIVFVRMGSFDDDPGVRPSLRAHVASAAVWERIPDDGLVRFPGPVDP